MSVVKDEGREESDIDSRADEASGLGFDAAAASAVETFMFSCSRCCSCSRSFPIPMFAAHQSMKGLPRWGVLIEVKDRGVYSVGLMCVMRCRQSRPPME